MLKLLGLLVFVVASAAVLRTAWAKRKPAKVSCDLTHETLFEILLPQLTEKYGLTRADIKDLYRVVVTRYDEPQPPLAIQAGTTPEDSEYVCFHVMLKSRFYIREGNEGLYEGVGISTNAAGKNDWVKRYRSD